MKITSQKIVAIIQLIGSIFGISLLIYRYVPQLLVGEFTTINAIIVAALISLFAICFWASVKALRDGQTNLLQVMLLFQIFSFSVGGFGYAFYSALTIPLGYTEPELGINLIVGSDAGLALNNAGPQITFTINLAALAFLRMIVKKEKATSRE
jgi:hypothetical protein